MLVNPTVMELVMAVETAQDLFEDACRRLDAGDARAGDFAHALGLRLGREIPRDLPAAEVLRRPEFEGLVDPAPAGPAVPPTPAARLDLPLRADGGPAWDVGSNAICGLRADPARNPASVAAFDAAARDAIALVNKGGQRAATIRAMRSAAGRAEAWLALERDPAS